MTARPRWPRRRPADECSRCSGMGRGSCAELADRYLRDQSVQLHFTEPDHFVFTWHARDKKLDPIGNDLVAYGVAQYPQGRRPHARPIP
jgi:hypothetical protein